MDIDVIKVIDKALENTIGSDILGVDINGQWYDSIKNGGAKIKTPKMFANEK